MNLLLWPLRILYTLYAVLLFVLLMFMVIPFVAVATFWGRVKGGNFIYHVLRVWSAIWFPLVGIRPVMIYEQKPDPRRRYIFVANHSSYLDSAIVVESIRQPFRPLGKHDMSKIPVFGYIYRVCVIMVDRSDPENRAKSIVRMKSILKKGISILIFPEGTFNMTNKPLKEFYDGAFRIAIETQTPIQPVLFLDAYDRMHYSHFFSLTPGKCRTVFLQEIPVEGLRSADMKMLKEKVFSAMEKKLREYGASWIGSEK